MRIKHPDRATGWFAVICISTYLVTSGNSAGEDLAEALAVNFAVWAFRTVSLTSRPL